MSQVIKAYLKL